MWPKKNRDRKINKRIQISISDDYRSWLALQRGKKMEIKWYIDFSA